LGLLGTQTKLTKATSYRIGALQERGRPISALRNFAIRVGRRAFWWRIVAFLWFAAIVVASLAPESWKVRLLVIRSLHLPAHFAIFACSGLLASAFSTPVRNQIGRCLMVIALAVVLEVLQARMSGNSIEWIDVVVDILGVLTAMALALIAGRHSSY
jgi:hypothetical protein